MPPLATGSTPVTDELAKSTALYSKPVGSALLAWRMVPSDPAGKVAEVDAPVPVNNSPLSKSNRGFGYVPVRSPPAVPVSAPSWPLTPAALNCRPVGIDVLGAALPVYPRFVSTTVVASVTLLTVKYPAVCTYTVWPGLSHAVLPTDTDTVLDTAGIVNTPLVVVYAFVPSVPLVPLVPGSPRGPGAMTTLV